MSRLFKNELLKMRYSRMLWVVLAGTLAFVVLSGCAPAGTVGWGEHGMTASFGYMRACGTAVMMFLSPIVGIFFTQELQRGTMHNTLSCGVSRRQYFFVKTICIMVVCLLDYLASVVIFTCLRTVISGFTPSGSYPYCGFAVLLVYQLGVCILQFANITLYMVVSVLTKKPAIVNLAGIVIWFCEGISIDAVPAFRHPMSVMIAMYDLWEDGKTLTLEFVRLFDHCLIMGIVFLALAYLIFQRKDIN